jgi:multidrug efflux system outer membrane protein
MPIFDGGRREAGIQSAGADLELANAGYREQVLVAFRDVEDQLSALRLLAGQSDALSRAAASASHAATLSESLHRNGLVSQLDLLDARRADLRARRTALGVQSQRYLATVGLVRALGGGWAPAAIVGQPAPESETALRTARR